MSAEPVPRKWAMCAPPLPGPSDLVPSGEVRGVDGEGRAVSPPLLQPTLPVGNGGPATPDTNSASGVPDQEVLAFPEIVGPNSSGQPFGPGRPVPVGQPVGLLAGQPQGPHLGVRPDQVLLPLSDLQRPVLI